ncbi:unnamed protein product [Mytilus edulis]|uniref:Reverse transcriptase zinc-binding domain-containing protein n=1 Tax=Mytilus edulis TaxID=6550 RepID=A0A8S3RA50_MYTED|nr:unnamed protein product [Mytilus edulis]
MTTAHHWPKVQVICNSSVKATHLGIDHDVNSKYGVKDCVPNRIQTARKTVYALMGAGLHGLNGLNPKVSMHLVKIYVLPRLLYGLDSIILSVSDMKLLSVYYTKLLKQIQHLPERTSTSAVYLLLGQIPVEAELHKRMLNFFGNIIRNHGSVERDVAIRQLAVMPRDSNSWFVKIIDLTEQYGLPSPHDLINVPPGKIEWKNIVRKSISSYWIDLLKSDVKSKSSLKFLNVNNITQGKTHNVWDSCGTEPFTSTMASIKAKIMCGTYTLQHDRAKFDRSGGTNSACKLCGKGSEDIKHFLLYCEKLRDIQEHFLNIILVKLYDCVDVEVYNEILSSEDLQLKVIIDCSSFEFLDESIISNIECVSRGYCYRLHQRRASLLQIT